MRFICIVSFLGDRVSTAVLWLDSQVGVSCQPTPTGHCTLHCVAPNYNTNTNTNTNTNKYKYKHRALHTAPDYNTNTNTDTNTNKYKYNYKHKALHTVQHQIIIHMKIQTQFKSIQIQTQGIAHTQSCVALN